MRGESKNHRIVFNGNGSLSPLVKINFDCINGFTLDYMHCVLLGVVNGILVFITKGPEICRLSNEQIQQISNHLLSLKLPSNFNRQPRSIKDLCYWKATEYRSFLLYLGPIVLKGILSEASYKHFLALRVVYFVG